MKIFSETFEIKCERDKKSRNLKCLELLWVDFVYFVFNRFKSVSSSFKGLVVVFCRLPYEDVRIWKQSFLITKLSKSSEIFVSLQLIGRSLLLFPLVIFIDTSVTHVPRNHCINHSADKISFLPKYERERVWIGQEILFCRRHSCNNRSNFHFFPSRSSSDYQEFRWNFFGEIFLWMHDNIKQSKINSRLFLLIFLVFLFTLVFQSLVEYIFMDACGRRVDIATVSNRIRLSNRIVCFKGNFVNWCSFEEGHSSWPYEGRDQFHA